MTIGAAADAVTTWISSSASFRIRGLRASAASIHRRELACLLLLALRRAAGRAP